VREELKESPELKSGEISSRGGKSGRLKIDFWREVMRWLTPSRIEALSDFMWDSGLSICVLAIVFLEAIGAFHSSRNSDLLLISLGASMASRLRRGSFYRRVRSRC
jgi:hypothetical protein